MYKKLYNYPHHESACQFDGSDQGYHEDEVDREVNDGFPAYPPEGAEPGVREEAVRAVPGEQQHHVGIPVQGDPRVRARYNHVDQEGGGPVLGPEHEEGEEVERGPEQGAEQGPAREDVVGCGDRGEGFRGRHVGVS